MLTLDFHPTGRHFCRYRAVPVPDRILRAMSLPTIDHRGPEFGALGLKVLADVRKIFKTQHPVVIYPASGHRCLGGGTVQCAEPGRPGADVRDRPLCLAVEQARHAAGHPDRKCWPEPGTEHGVPTSWRRGVQADLIEASAEASTRSTASRRCVVHNETSTGVTSNIAAVRRAIDAAHHPALLMVDTISGLASPTTATTRCGRPSAARRKARCRHRHQLQCGVAQGHRGQQGPGCPRPSGPGMTSLK